MAQQRKALWEADLDEDLQDVDLSLAIGNYGQNGTYEDGASLMNAYRTPSFICSKCQPNPG